MNASAIAFGTLLAVIAVPASIGAVMLGFGAGVGLFQAALFLAHLVA